jgi:hypothetical protein
VDDSKYRPKHEKSLLDAIKFEVAAASTLYFAPIRAIWREAAKAVEDKSETGAASSANNDAS